MKSVEERLYNAARVIACVALMAMIALTFVDVLGREFLSAVPGASEIISMLLGIGFYAGMPIVARENGHICVGILVERYPPRWRAVEKVVTRIVSVLAMALIAWLILSQANKSVTSQTLTEFLSFRLGYVVYVMGALAVIAVLVTLRGRPRP